MMRWGRESGLRLDRAFGPFDQLSPQLIIELAARYRLPTIYALRSATADGGLMSYGVDIPELFRQAAIYPIASSRVKSLPISQYNCRPSLHW